MPSRLLLMLGLAAAVAVAGCGGGGGPTGGPRAPVTVQAVLYRPSPQGEVTTESVSEIARVALTVSDGSGTQSEFDDIVAELTYDPQTYTAQGQVKVPIGAGRVFTVDALRADDLLLYTGTETVGVFGQTLVNITLRPPGVPLDVICPIHEFDGPPEIEITSVPEYGDAGVAQGSVHNVIPWECVVAVYIKVGSSWWTKPYWDRPITTIGPDGTWTCDIVTGGVDQTATEVRAYLIRAGYSPPLAPQEDLPPDPPTQDVLAVDSVTRTPPEE